MKLFISILGLLSLCFIGCQSLSPITIINLSSHPVILRFQTPFNDDTTKFAVGSTQNRVIQTIAVKRSTQDQRAQLVSILVGSDSDSSVTVLRFSMDYLESSNWTINIPFRSADSINFEKLQMLDKVRALENHSYYYSLQDLYNAQKFTECLKAIELVLPILSYRKTLIDHNSQIAEIDRREATVERDGFFLLAYLSAFKTSNRTRADYYWKQLTTDDPLLIQFLQKFDYEISKQRAG
jgi:hypothetical protein